MATLPNWTKPVLAVVWIPAVIAGFWWLVVPRTNLDAWLIVVLPTTLARLGAKWFAQDQWPRLRLWFLGMIIVVSLLGLLVADWQRHVERLTRSTAVPMDRKGLAVAIERQLRLQSEPATSELPAPRSQLPSATTLRQIAWDQWLSGFWYNWQIALGVGFIAYASYWGSGQGSTEVSGDGEVSVGNAVE